MYIMADSNELADADRDRVGVLLVDHDPAGRGGSAHPGAGGTDCARAGAVMTVERSHDPNASRTIPVRRMTLRL
jgi:hypothetical protein